MRSAINTTLKRLGYRVSRWAPPYAFIQHLNQLGINVVLDVGANAGQYGKLLRVSGYAGQIISFEPVNAPFAALSGAAASDPKWSAINAAAGAAKGEATINVNRLTEVSSLLTLRQNVQHGFETATETQSISIVRLDDVFEQYVKANDRVLLKMDVQGYENEVLKGAAVTLKKIAAVQTEMSIVPIYSGQQDMCTTIGTLKGSGFDLIDIANGHRDTDGRLMEADGFFVRLRIDHPLICLKRDRHGWATC